MPSAAAPRETPVTSLTPGMSIDDVLLLSSVEQRTKKNGDPFFMLQLSDGSGSINGVMWDNHHSLVAGLARRDDFVHVTAEVGEFNNSPQLTVKSLTRVEDSEVKTERFLPTSPRPRAEMEAELDAWIAKVKHPDCARLLRLLFGNERLREAYCTAPAAVRIHQPYIGGLLEHTLNVMRIADAMASLYEPINRDVLITGGLLHDIGKIRELEWRRTITYTTEGRLLGHIPIGSQMVDTWISRLKKSDDGFDDSIHMQIIHLILSHHGKLEYGSPVRPQTREAQVFHYADHADAYMTVFKVETEKAMAKGEAWTPFNRMFDSYLFAGAIPTGQSKVPSSEDLAYQDLGGQPVDDVQPAR
ncbi:HD domain-containing protein [bacterium]|nr:HD domain-containing protein [bacterium]